jgi:hypothetical protein
MPGLPRIAIPGLILSLSLALSVTARAQSVPRLAIDWSKTFEHATDWLHRNSERGSQNEMLLPSEGLQTPPPPSQVGNAWFGAAPHVSLVARDWGNARRLAGGPLSVTDQLRLSRSNRMVVSRIRLGEGRLIPFAQLGVGQWRIDTDLLLGHLVDTEVAVQFGAGFELRIWDALALAVETDYTVLCRDIREPQNLPSPSFLGVMAASRVRF